MTTHHRNEARESKVISWSPLMSSMVNSSAWMGRPPHHKIVWITILMSKNYKGYVDLSMVALARAAEVTIDECRDAIAWYEAPDPLSQNKSHEGRHIRPCDGGGWYVFNHFFYREMIASDSRKAFKSKWARDKRASINAEGKLEDNGGD